MKERGKEEREEGKECGKEKYRACTYATVTMVGLGAYYSDE